MSSAGMPSGYMPAPAPAPHRQHIHQQQQPQHYQQQGQPATHPLPLPQHQQHQQQLLHPQQHPHPQLQPPYDPSAMKLTRGTSCVLCQQRKVRCDKNKPCANCVKAKVECRVVPPQPPRRRKKRLQEKDLFERLRKYETLLNENGVAFDPIGHELRQDGPPGDDVDELEDDFEMLKTSPETSMSPSQISVKKEAPGAQFTLHKEFRASDQLVHDSSSDEEEQPGSRIHRAFDKIFSIEDGFPFVVGGGYLPVLDDHPSPIQIFQLWQVYIENVNCLLKITHVPTVQSQFLNSITNLEGLSKSNEALMFGIYVMAITSMDENEVLRIFHEPKQALLTRYLSSTQQALINADYMKVDDLVVLQAYVLYLFAVRWFTDPRQLFCLIGTAVRIAQRMGLHRDPDGHGLPPFEVEQRRRLWWLIVGYDRRLGEMTGSTVTALSSGGDCKLPLNVNDSDLHMDGKDMPTPHTGSTEMLFALTRIEMAMAVPSNSNRDAIKINNPDIPKGPSETPANAKAGQPTIRLACPDSPTYTLDGFCAHMEGTYLAHCDPKIPLHFFTMTMTRQALCKMRVLNFLVRMQDTGAVPFKEVERESLFLQATQMIEYDNVVQSSDSLAPFKWYARHHLPFPAYMFLVQELRKRTNGPMVERAWDAIAANYELRGLLNNFHNPMHVAFKGTFIKAWDAYESAQRSLGKQPPVPRFIVVLRDRSEQRRKGKLEKQNAALEAASATPRSQTSAHSGPGNMHMMTPPVDPSPRSYAESQSSRGGNDQQPDNMDWSYMGQGFRDPAPYQNPNFGNYGPYASPFGGGPTSSTGGGPPGSQAGSSTHGGAPMN